MHKRTELILLFAPSSHLLTVFTFTGLNPFECMLICQTLCLEAHVFHKVIIVFVGKILLYILDAIIWKKKKKKGSFSVNVKHYEYIHMFTIYLTAINLKIFLDTSVCARIHLKWFWNSFMLSTQAWVIYNLYVYDLENQQCLTMFKINSYYPIMKLPWTYQL